MCGLFGHRRRHQELQPEQITAIQHALGPRGPDGVGHCLLGAGAITLVHTRLALVDLEHGTQPFSNEDHTITAIVNGEIYDDTELRQTLVSRGHTLRTRCDSELVVHLYEDFGPEFLHYIQGEFSIVLYDSRRDLLLGAIDRFGVRPLLFHRSEHGDLFLASTMKALVAAGVQARWNVDAWRSALSMQYVPPGHTLFANVFRLSPGERIVVTREHHRVETWWQMDLPREDSAFSSAPASAPSLTPVLTRAIARRLRGDVPVAFYLSGGIDSSSILALAQQIAPRARTAFTVSFPDAAPWNEIEATRDVAAHLGVSLHEVACSRVQLLDALPAAVAAGEGLAINTHISAKYLVSRAVKQAGYSVVLTGEGADELLLGYPHFRQDFAHAHSLLRSPGSTERIVQENLVSAGAMVATARDNDTESPTFLHIKRAMGGSLDALLSPQTPPETLWSEYFSRASVREQLQGRSLVDRASWLWTQSALAGYILPTLGDGVEMSHGVESRLPFLDNDVFEVLRGCHTRHKIHTSPDGTLVEKFLLRNEMKSLLPHAMRPKHPFMAPPVDIASVLVRDLLQKTSLERVPFLDATRIEAFRARLETMALHERTEHEPVVMLLLTAVLLQQHFGL